MKFWSILSPHVSYYTRNSSGAGKARDATGIVCFTERAGRNEPVAVIILPDVDYGMNYESEHAGDNTARGDRRLSETGSPWIAVETWC